MSDRTSADLLRRAAQTLRDRASSAGTLRTPWRAVREPSRGDPSQDVTCLITTIDESVFEDSYCSIEDAEYIATVHPGVGLALAAWLDADADHVASHDCEAHCELDGCERGQCAMTVARLLVGDLDE